MSFELIMILIGLAGPVLGWWATKWDGPLARWWRSRRAAGPLPIDASTIEALKRLIPDDPESKWDDVARELLTVLAELVRGAPADEKLTIVERLLDFIKTLRKKPA